MDLNVKFKNFRKENIEQSIWNLELGRGCRGEDLPTNCVKEFREPHPGRE